MVFVFGFRGGDRYLRQMPRWLKDRILVGLVLWIFIAVGWLIARLFGGG